MNSYDIRYIAPNGNEEEITLCAESLHQVIDYFTKWEFSTSNSTKYRCTENAIVKIQIMKLR